MSHNWVAVMVTIGFSLLGVVGDYLLKLASQAALPLRTPSFFLGFAVYASTAFGWVFVMKYLKLATVGVVYSVSMIVFLTLVGWFFFGESLDRREIVGVTLAIASLYLLR